MKVQTEAEKFMEGVKGDESVDLDALNGQVTKIEVAPVKDVDPEEVPESIKNRQHKRLEQRLQAERETNIALNARLKAQEEFRQNVVKEIPIDNRFKRLFGEDEKGIEISKHFTEILNERDAKVREEALKEFESRAERQKREEAEAVSSYESKIESGLESIEDVYGIDMTSEASAKSRKEFLDFVTKIAPKDADGSPIELPDLVGAYEVFKSTKSPVQNTRRTEIAARSMQQSGQPNMKQEQLSDEARWLKQNGII